MRGDRDEQRRKGSGRSGSPRLRLEGVEPEPSRILEQREHLLALHGAPKEPLPRTVLEWIAWENVAVLVTEEKRALAFRALQRACGGDLRRLGTLSRERLHALASLGGPHAEKRAARLSQVAARIDEGFGGDVEVVRDWPAERARAALQRFPGIDEALADKILLFVHAHAVPAVEAHGLRVLTRLGHVAESGTEESAHGAVRTALAPLAARGCAWLVELHELLRVHGESVCRRNDPACKGCPLARSCPSSW